MKTISSYTCFMKDSRLNIREEIDKLIRFGIVGILATFVHVGVVVELSTSTGLHPVIINTIAFFTAFTISVTGHIFYSFNITENKMKAGLKFLLASLSSIALSNVVLALCMKILPVPISQGIAIVVIPAYTFVLSRFWAFKPSSS